MNRSALGVGREGRAGSCEREPSREDGADANVEIVRQSRRVSLDAGEVREEPPCALNAPGGAYL
jgi:hypothetical protein